VQPRHHTTETTTTTTTAAATTTTTTTATPPTTPVYTGGTASRPGLVVVLAAAVKGDASDFFFYFSQTRWALCHTSAAHNTTHIHTHNTAELPTHGKIFSYTTSPSLYPHPRLWTRVLLPLPSPSHNNWQPPCVFLTPRRGLSFGWGEKFPSLFLLTVESHFAHTPRSQGLTNVGMLKTSLHPRSENSSPFHARLHPEKRDWWEWGV
jgi:hypothetical protein